MKNTTEQTVKRLHQLAESASKVHSEAEVQQAYEEGQNSAQNAIKNGQAIFLQDEGQLFLSNVDFARIAGFNSQVFSDENKALLAESAKSFK